MRIEGTELITVDLPLTSPFRTAQGSSSFERKLLVRLLTDVGSGWGECAALAEPLYTDEYVDGARHVIATHLLPRLAAAGVLGSPDRVAGVLEPVQGHRMAKSAVEMAVLDAWGRATGRSLASLLGATRATVPAGVAVGLADSVDDLLGVVGAYLAEGYVRVKLKIQPGWDVEPVRAVRQRFGAGLALQVDANGAYAHGGRAGLRALDQFGLTLIEQPLAADDLSGHAGLARSLATPICLDESITSVATAALALDLGACSVINLKPGRVGGYLEARRIHDLARGRGAALWCGGMLETGLGRAANLALAALPGFTVPGDLSASRRYYERDLTAPFELHDGHLTVPTGPGLGVDVDEDALAAFTTSHHTWRP
ncbi:MAG TPA: o-succinylbenzoate synthase [Acidimicrobiales bacterium]|nr:o-succinylbenzoate synthase [Acidimicrobiales bacterium]